MVVACGATAPAVALMVAIDLADRAAIVACEGNNVASKEGERKKHEGGCLSRKTNTVSGSEAVEGLE